MIPALDAAVSLIGERTPVQPVVGVVLGSGLGGFSDAVQEPVEIPYAEIPGWPASTAVGHAGTLVIGTAAGVPVAVMKGRAHLYEGHPAEKVVFGVRVLGRLGVRTLVLTNACGAVNTSLEPGRLVLISDHLNLQSTSPLVGPNEESLGPRFPDMSDAYDPALRGAALAASRDTDVALQQGVYAGLLGPSYETPAERRPAVSVSSCPRGCTRPGWGRRSRRLRRSA